LQSDITPHLHYNSNNSNNDPTEIREDIGRTTRMGGGCNSFEDDPFKYAFCSLDIPNGNNAPSSSSTPPDGQGRTRGVRQLDSRIQRHKRQQWGQQLVEQEVETGLQLCPNPFATAAPHQRKEEPIIDHPSLAG
jgi:hypothetical protein